MRRLVVAAATLVVLLWACASAQAHAMPMSNVLLDIGAHEVTGELELPARGRAPLRERARGHHGQPGQRTVGHRDVD